MVIIIATQLLSLYIKIPKTLIETRTDEIIQMIVMITTEARVRLWQPCTPGWQNGTHRKVSTLADSAPSCSNCEIREMKNVKHHGMSWQ